MADVRDLMMPKLGLTMEEGEVVEWNVQPGHSYSKGDVLVTIESDKAVVEVEAEEDGVLVEQLVRAGDQVDIGTPIGRWTPAPEDGASTDGKPESKPSPTDSMAGPATADTTQELRTRPSLVHASMARRLTKAQQEVPHFYLITEAEVAELDAARRRLNEEGRRVSVTHLVVAAVARSLRDMPEINRVWQDGELVTFSTVDIGVAVDSPRGLLTPVVRGVDGNDLASLVRSVDEVVERARGGNVGAEALSGGAITVSNLGMYDVTYIAPIINPPHAAVLGVGSTRELFRPDDEGRPALRRELGLTLTCDHRVLDGVAALRFLNRVKGHLEAPDWVR